MLVGERGSKSPFWTSKKTEKKKPKTVAGRKGKRSMGKLLPPATNRRGRASEVSPPVKEESETAPLPVRKMRGSEKSRNPFTEGPNNLSRVWLK